MVELGWPADHPIFPIVEEANREWIDLVYGRHSSLRNANPRLHAATLCGLGDWWPHYEGRHRA